MSDFDWRDQLNSWKLGIGSDMRYSPRWWERRAYVMGLRDAAREAESLTWERNPNYPTEANQTRRNERPAHIVLRELVARLLARAVKAAGSGYSACP